MPMALCCMTGVALWVEERKGSQQSCTEDTKEYCEQDYLRDSRGENAIISYNIFVLTSLRLMTSTELL